MHLQQTMAFPEMLKGQGIATKAKKERSRLIRKVVTLLLVVTGCALIAVWSRVAMVTLGYQVSNLTIQATDLAKQVSHLQIEVESLRSPARLEKSAREILNMRPAKGDEVILVKKTEKGVEQEAQQQN